MEVTILLYLCNLILGVVLSVCVRSFCQTFPKSGNKTLFICTCLVLSLTLMPFYFDIVLGVGSTIAFREGMCGLLPIPNVHFTSQLLCLGMGYMLNLLLGVSELRKTFNVKYTRIYVMFFLLEAVWFLTSLYICIPELTTTVI